uniref:Uncharacterized protein n=1 Tax=Arundo donax TaxID=35708 RepID=A0A0A9GT38_ARUDO
MFCSELLIICSFQMYICKVYFVISSTRNISGELTVLIMQS